MWIIWGTLNISIFAYAAYREHRETYIYIEREREREKERYTERDYKEYCGYMEYREYREPIEYIEYEGHRDIWKIQNIVTL